MRAGRLFAAQFLVPVGPGFVAVDRVQPVALMLMPDGSVPSVASWAEEVAPPVEAASPNRRIGIGEGHLVVQDLPDGRPVRLAAGGAGSLSVEVVADSAALWDGLTMRHARMFRSGGGGTGEWRLVAQFRGYRWTSQVQRHRDGVVSVWRAGRGSIVAHAVRGDVIAVAVRRADKRPWHFDPVHELCVLRAQGPGIAPPVPVDPLDVTDRCWVRAPRPVDPVRSLQTYLPYTVAGADALRRHGATDVRIEVVDVDTWPVIELSFTLPQRPGVRFVRRDEPFDELGHLSGLRFLNISMDEESVPMLLEAATPVGGRFHV